MKRTPLWAAALLLPACGGGGGSGGLIGPGVTVVNVRDRFTASIVGFGYDGAVDQDWSCSTGQANLTLASSMSAGRVDIYVYDAVDDPVYANSHRGIGGLSVQTRPGGVPGTWRVVLDFHDATISGAIVLEADASPPDPDRVSVSSAFGTRDNYRFHAEWPNGNAAVSVGNVSAGALTIRLWDGLSDPASDPPTYQAAGIVAAFSDSPSGAGGLWTIDLDYSGDAFASGVSITGD